MHTFSNNNRSNGGSDTQIESSAFDEADQFFKDEINKANAVSIISVLKYYGIKIDIQERKISCPFLDFHKNGRDKSPSFYIYHDTNSFYCFGCKSGGSAVNFVATMENIGKYKAAQKILSLGFNSDIATINDYLYDPTETLTILIDFSNHIREKIKANINDRGYMLFIDEICATLDTLHEKYKNKMSNDTLRVLIDRLKMKVEEYK